MRFTISHNDFNDIHIKCNSLLTNSKGNHQVRLDDISCTVIKESLRIKLLWFWEERWVFMHIIKRGDHLAISEEQNASMTKFEEQK